MSVQNSDVRKGGEEKAHICVDNISFLSLRFFYFPDPPPPPPPFFAHGRKSREGQKEDSVPRSAQRCPCRKGKKKR